MAMVFWALGLSLLMQGCWCSIGLTDTGCMTWTPKGDNVCCEACHPGHHLVKECGPNPKDLCTPCKTGTYSKDPKRFRCTQCTQCVGAQVYVKQCTATTDTQCGCREGLTCGDDHCSFCVKKCDKGQEPIEKRLCRTCPHGTFNDQIHQMCKPWSTKCPHPGEEIVANGDAFTDIKCANISVGTVSNPEQPGRTNPTEQALPLVFFVVIIVGVLICFSICIVIFNKKVSKKRKKVVVEEEEEEEEEEEKPITKTPIITTPTDDPRTLIAIECSFHEAQQEQGSSSESLNSKDSSDQLIV